MTAITWIFVALAIASGILHMVVSLTYMSEGWLDRLTKWAVPFFFVCAFLAYVMGGLTHG
jgi:phosphoglycerol transferase MdoB-like AlkP superfamily enzyme